MKLFISIITVAYYLIITTECRAQADLLISIEFYNSGIDHFSKGEYGKADSAFTYSLKKSRSAETYFNRALTRKKLGSVEGFCNDMYLATANGDSTARMIFVSKCTTNDTSYLDASNKISDKISSHKTKIVARHKYDVNSDILLIDSLGRISWNIKTDSISPLDKDSSVFSKVEFLPSFPGNEQELVLFIKRNIKYPPEALKQKIQGLVYVTFLITSEGKVEDIKVLKGINEELDNEAVRVAGLMPPWFPAMMNGKFVNVQFNLPVRFSLKK